MMCKLGFDIKMDDMSENDRRYCILAVKNYNSLKPVILPHSNSTVGLLLSINHILPT